MEIQMNLKQTLQKIMGNSLPVLLSDSHQDWEALDLLNNLSELKLNRQVYLQPGLYIAEISEKGYLGTVLYRIKSKPI